MEPTISLEFYLGLYKYLQRSEQAHPEETYQMYPGSNLDAYREDKIWDGMILPSPLSLLSGIEFAIFPYLCLRTHKTKKSQTNFMIGWS